MSDLDKKSLSERDICTKFITPALVTAGWDVETQIWEEVSFTKGRVIVRGRMTARGEASRADYILYHKPGIPLAVLEAKDNNHSVGSGMQQALRYCMRHLPPLAEQRRIVAKVDELMAVLDALEAALTAARTTAEKLLAATVAKLHAA